MRFGSLTWPDRIRPHRTVPWYGSTATTRRPSRAGVHLVHTPGPLSQEGHRPDTPTHHGPAAGPRDRRWPDRDGPVHRPVDRPLRVARLARRHGRRRDRPVRRGRGLRARPRRRAVAPGPVPPADPAVDPARGHRCPRRGPAPRGRRLHDALPAQAAERQPAVPAPAVLVPGRPDARLAERRSGPSSSGCGARLQRPLHARRRRQPGGRGVRRRGRGPHRARAATDRLPGRPARPGIGATGAGLSRPVLGTSTRSRTSSTGRSSTRWRSASASRTGRWSSRSRACARTRAGSSASPSPRRR